MNKLSNKGQSLVIFIAFLPMLVIISLFVIDISLAKYNSNKINNITKEIIRYGLKNIDADPYPQMVDLIYQNDSMVDNYNINIDKEKKVIKMSLDKVSKGLFSSILGKELYKEKCSYVGYFKDSKIIIERDGA